MSFFAILAALLLEQARPMSSGNPIHIGVRSWVQGIANNFDAGRPHHGWVAWVLAVSLPSLATLAVYWFLVSAFGWALGVLWSVVVLYITLGFRQFSHHFTDIRDALEAGEEARARALLAEWKQIDARDLPRSEIVRHVIEYSVLQAHRHVFGVLCWYAVLAALGLGPMGAVIYRLSEFVARNWKPKPSELVGSATPGAVVHDAATAAWQAIDWIPVRVTALSFAVVGSFEEAIDSWRQHAQNFPGDNDGVLLAATSGAINVRLGGEAALDGADPAEPGLEPVSFPEQAQEPVLAHLRSIVGLVWRSVVLWMLMLALLTLARLMG
ncbi:MAG: CobD/CbiB family protein [Gammaproteobacteria bacterium]|nr:CobD/CbiB family protein [Gammaproteobacteria bacterium]MBU0788524.1 CobD/CbiB family protein [Gammaproteobacteria bacterium]MBU0815652.1 CobD/CbiB family protein [Gammaproteobacteria bacterium]MBU1788140.1 CobD/CbiB family protein [Gammaproteobacteria bacterium]